MYHFSNIYKENNKYQFCVGELNIRSDDLNQFNNNFIELRARFQNKKDISKGKIKKITNTCLLLHNKIYNDLINQTKDKKLIKFLRHIEFFSYKNLDETLKFFLGAKCFKDLDNYNYKNLKKNFYYKGHISRKNLDLILINSNKYLRRLFDNAKKGKNKRSDLTISDPLFNRKISRILNTEFKQNGTLQNLKIFFGYEMIVSGAALELSVPGSNWWRKNLNANLKNNLTSYIHTDETLTVPKSIIYLTDVNYKNGPLTFYPGILEKIGIKSNPFANLVSVSIHNAAERNKKFYKYSDLQPMSSTKFRKHFMFLPEQIRLSSHFGWDIKKKSKIEKFIDSKKDFIIGKKGKFAIFDGHNVLHRGGIINNGYRLALQVTFRKKLSKFNFLYNLIKKKIIRKR